MTLRGNIDYRMVIPRGKITAIGDTVYKSNEAVAYDITITTMLDDAGYAVYEYMAPHPSSGESAASS